MSFIRLKDNAPLTSLASADIIFTAQSGSSPVAFVESKTTFGQFCSSITTLGTITSGTWNGSTIDLAHGGTGANLTASNGGIFYSTGSAGAILAGTSTARQILLSGSSASPTWSTAQYPAGTSANSVLASSSANVIQSLGNFVLQGVPQLVGIGASVFGQVVAATGCTAVGSGAASALTNGTLNSFFGVSSGSLIDTGGGNSLFGANTNVSSSGATNRNAFGQGITVSTDNTIVLGNTSVTTAKIANTTYPTTTTINQLLYSSSANTISGLATSNNGVLVTDGSGVPSISSTLPGNLTVGGNGAFSTSNGVVLDDGTGLTTLSNAVVSDSLFNDSINCFGQSTSTAGTIAQSGNTITGVGTSFSSAMVGGILKWTSGGALGTYALITSFTNSTSITVDTSNTIPAGQTYIITYNGLSTNGSDIGISSANIYGSPFHLTSVASVIGHGTTGYSITGGGNTIFGASAGTSLTTGTNCTVIGKTASVSSASADNQIVIGKDAAGVGDHIAVIGSSVITNIVSGSTTGGCDLGSSANPFGNLWLLSTGSNKIKVATASIATANRTYTMPDAGADAQFSMNLFNKGIQTLTDASSISFNIDQNGAALLTLTANGHTINIPSNITAGMIFRVLVTSAGFSGSWASGYSFPDGTPSFNLVSGSVDIFTFIATSNSSATLINYTSSVPNWANWDLTNNPPPVSMTVFLQAATGGV